MDAIYTDFVYDVEQSSIPETVNLISTDKEVSILVKVTDSENNV